MKYLILLNYYLLLTLVVAGCTSNNLSGLHKTEPKFVNGSYSIARYIDRDNSVICYALGTGLSCVHVNMPQDGELQYPDSE